MWRETGVLCLRLDKKTVMAFGIDGSDGRHLIRNEGAKYYRVKSEGRVEKESKSLKGDWTTRLVDDPWEIRTTRPVSHQETG